MNHNAKYIVEMKSGKYLSSMDGRKVIFSGQDKAKLFRTKMEADIFLNTNGIMIDSELSEFPKIIEV